MKMVDAVVYSLFLGMVIGCIFTSAVLVISGQVVLP